MKKFLLICVLAILGMAVHAQKQYKAFDDDAIQGDTTTYTSNYKVTKYANTFVGFVFTKADVADSLAVARLEGSMDNSTFVALTGTAALTETTTDGTTFLYVTSPKYLYYRAWLSCASGDTVTVTDAKFVIKED